MLNVVFLSLLVRILWFSSAEVAANTGTATVQWRAGVWLEDFINLEWRRQRRMCGRIERSSDRFGWNFRIVILH